MTKLAVKVSRATSGLLCLTPAAVVIAPAAQACDACGGAPAVTAPTPVHTPVHPIAPISAPSFSTPTPIAPTTSTITISPTNSILTPGTNSVSPKVFSRSGSSAIFTQIPQFQQNLTAAQAAYDAATVRLADAQNASKGPVRYARIPTEVSDCGCLNAENVSDNNSSSDLAAAQAGEAEAAARLSQVQTETRQFLENAKSETTTNNSPIW